MTKLNQITNLFLNSTITDILILGYINHDTGINKFTPHEKSVYLEFGNFLLRFASVNQYNQMQIDIVSNILFDFEIDAEDDFCICSVMNLYMYDPYGINRIISAEFLLDEESNLDECLVKCVYFQIGNINYKDYLFLDPTHTFGIQINKQRSIDEWIEKVSYKNTTYTKFVWCRNN